MPNDVLHIVFILFSGIFMIYEIIGIVLSIRSKTIEGLQEIGLEILKCYAFALFFFFISWIFVMNIIILIMSFIILILILIFYNTMFQGLQNKRMLKYEYCVEESKYKAIKKEKEDYIQEIKNKIEENNDKKNLH